MNKKTPFSSFKIFGIILINILVILTGCKSDFEELFDENPQKRILNVIEDCKSTLLKESYGWKMNYETGTGDKFLFLMKFNQDNTVEMRSDFTDQTVKSTYKYSRTDGPVITFDTYGLLHWLADPSVKPSEDDKKGYGYAGDFEFIIHKVTPDSIILKGRKTYNKVKLEPASKADEKLLVESEIFTSFKNLLSNEKFFKVLMNNNIRISDVELSSTAPNSKYVSAYNNPPSGKITLSYLGDDNQELIKSSDLSFNDEGFSLVNPIDIKGEKLSDFIWDESVNTFVLKGNKDIMIMGSDLPSAIDEHAFERFMAIDDNLTKIETSNAVENDFLDPLKAKYNDNGIRFQIYYGRYSSDVNFVLYTPGNPMGDGKWAYLNTKTQEVNANRPDIIHFKLNKKRPYRRTFWPEIIENTTEGKALYEFLTTPEGLLIYIKDNKIYLINSTNSKYWLAFDIP